MNKNNNKIHSIYFLTLIPSVYLLDKLLYYKNKKENVVKILIKLLIEIFLTMLVTIIITKHIFKYLKIKNEVINPIILLSFLLIIIYILKSKTYTKFKYLINTIEPFVNVSIKTLKLQKRVPQKPRKKKIFSKFHYRFNNSDKVKKIYDKEGYDFNLRNNDIISGKFKYADVPLSAFYQRTKKKYDFVEG